MMIQNDGLQHHAARIARVARSVMETQWPIWRGYKLTPDKAISLHACYITSMTLEKVLTQTLPEHAWHVVTGRFCECRKSGTIYYPISWKHTWITCANDHSMTIDITADQFGADAVIVAFNDHRYHDSRHHPQSQLSIHDNGFANTWSTMILSALSRNCDTYSA